MSPIFRRNISSRPTDLFARDGRKFFLASSRREVAQMVRWANDPREQAQAYWAVFHWGKQHARTVEDELGKVCALVWEAGGEWWLPDFEPAFDSSGNPVA